MSADGFSGVSARSSEAGSSPSAVEMSVIPSRIAPGSGAAGPPGTAGAQPAAIRDGRGFWWLRTPGGGGRVARPVVPEVEQRDRVHLEVQVVRRAFGVARVAHDPDPLPRLHPRAV